MGNKKKRSGPTVEEAIERPWCYYCERDFIDQKVLIDHQKAKHYSCPSCNRKLNTAGGLSVHLQQVHKETLTHIENAIEWRQKFCPEIEIFGMMGIPDDLVEAHKQRITNEFFKIEAERSAMTGNPPPGQQSGQPATKKRKTNATETPADIQARKVAWRAEKAAKKQAEAEGKTSPDSDGTPAPADMTASAPAHVPVTATAPAQAPIATQPASAYASAYGATTTYGAPATYGAPTTYSAPGYPTAHSAYPTQQHVAPFPYASSPQGFSAQGYSSYGPQHLMRSSPPNHAPFAAPPQYTKRFPPSSPMASTRDASLTPSYNAATPPNQIGGLHRQNSLPTAPGQPPVPGQPAPPNLPARPAFDPPSVNRQGMQALHTGQAPPASINTAAITDSNVDEVLASFKREFKADQAAAEAAAEAPAEAPAAAAEHPDSVEELVKSVEKEYGIDAADFPVQRAIVDTINHDAAVASIADAKSNDKTDNKTDSKTDGKKKKSKPSHSRLIFSNSENAPEELMSRWLRFFYERENGVEWSEGPIGAAVTGVTVDEDTVLDPQN